MVRCECEIYQKVNFVLDYTYYRRYSQIIRAIPKLVNNAENQYLINIKNR